MLTPSFELSQDDTLLTILIKARYAKVSEAEIYVDGTDFKFYSKPYFLRLTLPGRVVEDGRETAKYDVEKGYFTIKIPKETPGEHFDGLDMLTTLLAPAGTTSAKEPVLEIIDSEPTAEDVQGAEIDFEGEYEDEEEIDWQLPQQPFEEDEMTLGGCTYYGFANKRTGVFARLQDELCGIVDVPDPDSMTLSARREARQQMEQLKFDEDHYIGDFMEDDCIQSVLEYKTKWDEDYHKVKEQLADDGKVSAKKIDSIVALTEEERDQMIKFSKKEFLLDEKTEASVMLGLVDIIFAYAYDVRTTEGEHSVESAWNICKLSSTLSWLDCFGCLDDVINACFTRGLTYPLYRHWQLNIQILKDVTMIFHLGRKQILKCLLDIRQILSNDEPHYILNDLYITDYCLWIQSVSHAKILSLAQALEKFQISKSQMVFNLKEIEHAGVTMQDQHKTIDSDDDANTSDESSDVDTTSDDDSSSDDDTTSDDVSSAKEGDDKSEDVMSRLTNVTRVRHKKQSSSDEEGCLETIHQYGYPHVLRDEVPDGASTEDDPKKDSLNKVQQYGYHNALRDQEPHCASVNNDFDCDQNAELENRLNGSNAENLSTLDDKLVILNPRDMHVEDRMQSMLIEEIQDIEEDANKRTNIHETSSNIDELSTNTDGLSTNNASADIVGIATAVQNITLLDSKEEQESDVVSHSMSGMLPCGLQSSDNLSKGCQNNAATCTKRTVAESNDSEQICTFENKDTKDVQSQKNNVVGTFENVDSTSMGENNQEDLETWMKSPPCQKIEIFEDD